MSIWNEDILAKGSSTRLLRLLCLAFILTAQLDAEPKLELVQNANTTITLSWSSADRGFALETSTTLGLSAVWQPVSTQPVLIDGGLTVSMSAGDLTRYFRLRAVVASVLETSPARGEAGVAVTRETIFRFSDPLSPDLTLTGDELFAEFGGRRLLSRAELSSDRKTATLFYLENLPASARIRVTLDGTDLLDSSSRSIDADGDGQAGGVGVLEFNTAGITGLANTAVMGSVFASEKNPDGSNRPLENVTVTVDGAEESLRTVTDASGHFRLSPAPAGRFFVHVDGRTAIGSQWPGGAYYPFVGKAWEAVAGRTNNLAGGSGEIYLPRIQSDALTSVSATQPTKVTFSPSVLATNPALAGVEVNVPANSLFSDNGARGGKVGIAPVLPDRLPEPLPPGLNLPLVITVQTDGGANFDRPVPVRFPNLPDPVTGLKLGPGEKTALWSFNHDTGRWEAQGTATISADGQFAVTDPGVGLRQPGWHGVGPGTGGRGPGPNGAPGPGPWCTEPDCPCYRPVLCTIRHEGKHYMLCALSCLGNTFNRLFRNNGGRTRSPIQDGMLCIGGPDKCPARPDDVLTKEQRDCMDACRYPDNEYIVYNMPCEGFVDPCPPNPGLQSLDDGFAPISDRLQEQYFIWDVEEDYLVKFTGTSKIVQMQVEELPRLHDFLDLFSTYVGPESQGGIHLTAAERSELLALPRPSQFDATDWQKMIDRLDSLQGVNLPPDVALAKQRLDNAITLLQARGWKYRLDGLVEGHARLSQSRAPVLGSAQFPARGHYFFLQNFETGLIQRGRLSSSGTLEGIILAPENYHLVAYYDPETRNAGAAIFMSRSTGETTEILTAPLDPLPTDLVDQDGDSLPDIVELLLGTNSGVKDSDGDQVHDAQEILSGTNPLDGQPTSLGAINALDTPGNAVDVCAWNDLAAVADSGSGVALFDVTNPRAPMLLAQMDTPGKAVAVAGSGQRLAVADGPAGVSQFDVSDPSAPTLLSQTVLDPSAVSAQAVAILDGLAVVGTAAGQLVSLNEFGDIVQRLDLASGVPIQDLAVVNGVLYVMQVNTFSAPGTLSSVTMSNRVLSVSGSVPCLGTPGASGRRLHLSSDGQRLFAAHTRGYNVFDVSNPWEPPLLLETTTAQFGWKQMVHDGNGLGLGVVGVNSTDDGAHDISLYDLGASGTETNFLTTLVTPGLASAASLYRGILLVADGASGLSVVEYAGPDTANQPPVVTLAGTFTSGPVSQLSGQVFRLRALAVDDVRVRQVEFLMDGVVVATDGNLPFEVELNAPVISPAKTSFVVQARAVDTAGNSTLSAPLTLVLVPDTVAPVLTSITPTNNTLVAPLHFTQVVVTFSERMAPVTVNALNVSMKLIEAGTATPVPVTISLAPNQARVTVKFPAQPDSDNPRRLLLTVSSAVTDLVGNPLAAAFVAEFPLAPVNRLVSGTTWNDAANWRAGLPTATTPVQLGVSGSPREVQLKAPEFGQAFSLISHDDLALSTGLSVVQDAVFHGSLAFVGQSSLNAGRDVQFRGGVEAIGEIGGATLIAATARNFGEFLMNKDSSGAPLQIQGTTVFRNEPGATFDLRAGVVSMSPDARFENRGTLIHAGSAPALLASASFQNFGRVEVAEGRLELLGGSEQFGVMSVGNGATLVLGNGTIYALPSSGLGHVFASSSRLEGTGALAVREAEARFNGAVDYQGPIRFESSRGSLVFAGVTRLRGGLNLSGEFQNPFAGSRRGNDVTFSGLSAQLDQPVFLGSNSVLTFNQSIPALVTGLDARDQSRLQGSGSVIVTGSATLESATLAGTGLVRFDGPVALSVLTTQGANAPAAPKVIEFNGVTTAQGNHFLRQTILRVQTNGVLDLVGGGSWRLGGSPAGVVRLENYGVIRHSDSQLISFQFPIVNSSELDLSSGVLQLSSGSTLTQVAGLMVIRGGHLKTDVVMQGGVFRLVTGQFTGSINFFGGQLDFPAGGTLDGTLRLSGGILDLATVPVTIPTILQTNGVLRLNGEVLTVTSGYQCVSPATLTGHGTLLGSGGGSGDLSPGSPLGVLTVNGNYNLDSGSRFIVEIGGLSPGVDFDQLKASTVDIGSRASLDVRLVNGFNPPLGAEFPIIVKTSGGTPRAFRTVSGLTIGNNRAFELVYGTTGVTLRVIATP